MAFQAGVSGNPNGRPKGSSNRITQELQDKISTFLSDNIDTIQQEYNQLSPNDKLKFLANILPYVMPKMKEMEGPVQVLEKGNIYNLINGIGGTVLKKPVYTQEGSDKGNGTNEMPSFETLLQS